VEDTGGSKEEVPLPVKSRRYDDKFWKELLGGNSRRSKEENIKELGY